VIVLLVFLILRTLLVGSRSDPFGQLVCVGVAVWFAVQAFENIGMNIGIMPVTGLPLPFLSYGGSSMFAAWLALGLVNNVHLAGAAHRR
jgi:rod shape determining protein RodA